MRDVIPSRAAALLVDIEPGSRRDLHPFTFDFCSGGFRVFWRFWWGEHCACRWFSYKEGVGGSSPSTPTGSGEWSRFVIAGHAAGTVFELVPHVFGASQRPTGTRGLFAQWRFASKVIDVDAFRRCRCRPPPSGSGSSAPDRPFVFLSVWCRFGGAGSAFALG